MATEPQGTTRRERRYLVSENQIRNLVVGSFVLMLIALSALLLWGSSLPKGQLSLVDRSQPVNTRERAHANLTTPRALDNGRVTIDIEDAMRLVVERGVVNPFAPQ